MIYGCNLKRGLRGKRGSEQRPSLDKPLLGERTYLKAARDTSGGQSRTSLSNISRRNAELSSKSPTRSAFGKLFKKRKRTVETTPDGRQLDGSMRSSKLNLNSPIRRVDFYQSKRKQNHSTIR